MPLLPSLGQLTVREKVSRNVKNGGYPAHETDLAIGSDFNVSMRIVVI
ncbi:MAG: hypothetical protein K8R89_05345 [Anaerolineae bacterium]|nr:hypothetical protein [Anaerolineae bacterium]